MKHRAVLIVDDATHERMQRWTVADHDQITAALATFSRLFDLDPLPIIPGKVIDVVGIRDFVDIAP